MTNLIAVIFLSTVTNWTDVARITPIIPESERTYALYRPASTVQRGQIITNTMARLKFEGRDVEVVLKSQNGPVIERTISDVDRR